MRYALLSVTADPRYECLAPIAAHCWRLNGWTPLVLLVGNEGEWDKPREQRALAELERAGSRIERIPWLPVPAWSHAPHFHAATACRRPAAALLVDPDDYVVLGDADMLLLDGTYLSPDPAKRLQIWCFDAYEGHARYPSCYQGAAATTWRELLNLSSTALAAATWEHMERTRARAIAMFGLKWDCEPGMQAALAEWPGFPDACQFVPTRCRATINENGLSMKKGTPVDLHLRGVWADDAAWATARGFLDARYRADVVEGWSDYRREWLSLCR